MQSAPISATTQVAAQSKKSRAARSRAVSLNAPVMLPSRVQFMIVDNNKRLQEDELAVLLPREGYAAPAPSYITLTLDAATSSEVASESSARVTLLALPRLLCLQKFPMPIGWRRTLFPEGYVRAVYDQLWMSATDAQLKTLRTGLTDGQHQNTRSPVENRKEEARLLLGLAADLPPVDSPKSLAAWPAAEQ